MADEYIRKQDAVDALDRIFDNVPMELTTEILRLRRELRGLHAADVAPVVRCGQCGYWHGNDGDYGYCYAKDGQGFGHTWGKNDFCSYGERKE